MSSPNDPNKKQPLSAKSSLAVPSIFNYNETLQTTLSPTSNVSSSFCSANNINENSLFLQNSQGSNTIGNGNSQIKVLGSESNNNSLPPLSSNANLTPNTSVLHVTPRNKNINNLKINLHTNAKNKNKRNITLKTTDRSSVQSVSSLGGNVTTPFLKSPRLGVGFPNPPSGQNRKNLSKIDSISPYIQTPNDLNQQIKRSSQHFLNPGTHNQILGNSTSFAYGGPGPTTYGQSGHNGHGHGLTSVSNPFAPTTTFRYDKKTQDFALRKSKLQAVNRTSALLAGFAMVAMVEVQIDSNEDYPTWLLVAFSCTTTLLVMVHLISLMISTCLLPNMEVYDQFGEKTYFPSPDGHFKRHIEVAWILSTGIGLVLRVGEFVQKKILLSEKSKLFCSLFRSQTLPSHCSSK